MNKLFKNFLAVVLCTLALASCVVTKVSEKDIAPLKDKIDTLKALILSGKEQANAIDTSISRLKATSKQLNDYLETLMDQYAALERADQDLKQAIDEVREEFAADLSAEKAEILLSLETDKAEVEGALSVINGRIEALEAKKETADAQIDSLKAYVDTGLQNTKDWAAATFATLEKQNEVCTTVAGIQADIQAINSTLDSLQTKIEENKAELEGKISALSEQTASDLQAAVSTLEDKITAAKNEITEAYTGAIKDSLTSLETSLKSWVND